MYPVNVPSAFLAVPAPGDASLATIRRKVRLLAARSLLTAPWRPGAEVRRVLEAALRARPDDVLDVIGGPDVLAGALIVHGGAGRPEDVLPDTFASLLAGLVGRGLLPEAALLDLARPTRMSDGAHFVRADLRAIVALPTGLEVETADGLRGPIRWEAEAAPLGVGRLHLAPFDTNPLAMWEEHPEKQGNAVSLGDRPLDAWVAALREALELVRIGLPSWFAELPVALERIVPVGYEPERHLSASYREVPGLAYLTLHPDPLTLAEALVHETQHGKLNLATWLDPILRNGRTFWTSSPVRPDLRPLMGVLLAVHAFVPVAALHRGLLDADHPLTKAARFEERRQQVLAGNARGLALVQAHGDATPLGKRVVDGLAAMHAALAAGERSLDPEALPPG
jgi:HEXXH motif-containing protein